VLLRPPLGCTLFPYPSFIGYFAGMDSNDLTKQQAEQLLARVWPVLRYLKRLKDRMERRGLAT
jgi:hypothetical protein